MKLGIHALFAGSKVRKSPLVDGCPEPMRLNVSQNLQPANAVIYARVSGIAALGRHLPQSSA